MTDAIQTVRDRHEDGHIRYVDGGLLVPCDVCRALDRIEAVVKAARDVRYDVMNEGFLSQETSDQVHAALEALDSQEERT